MRILVNATALKYSGARTILEQFIEHASTQKDMFFYIFVDSSMRYNDTENIKFIPEIISGWFGRILWDCWGLKNKAEKLALDVSCILSLQNTSINFPGVKQVLYIHQPIPFSSVNFSFCHEPKLFLYKKFYSKFIFLFSQYIDYYVVQTEWMKRSLCDNYHVECSKVSVIKPNASSSQKKTDISLYQSDENETIKLFYPASSVSYKNHLVILDAISLILKKTNFGINVEFWVTLNRGDSRLFDSKVERLGIQRNVKYLGYLSKDEVNDCYQNCSIMVFPSFLETFGLPLQEAASLGCKIISSDLEYAREVLNGYKNSMFVPYHNSDLWAKGIIELSEVETIPCSMEEYHSGWPDLFDILRENYVC